MRTEQSGEDVADGERLRAPAFDVDTFLLQYLVHDRRQLFVSL